MRFAVAAVALFLMHACGTPAGPGDVVRARAQAYFGEGDFKKAAKYQTKESLRSMERKKVSAPGVYAAVTNGGVFPGYSITIVSEKIINVPGRREAEVSAVLHIPGAGDSKEHYYLVEEDGEWKIQDGIF